MLELQRQIDAEIKKLLGKESQFLSDLFKDVVKDYAHLWEHIKDLQKIRRLLIVIVRLFIEENPNLSSLSDIERIKFKDKFRELVTSPRALLEKSKRLQIKRIDGLTPKNWLIRFRNDIEEILYIIAKRANYGPGLQVESKIIKVPFYIQGMDECGPTSLKMVLKYFGYELDLQRIKQLCSFHGGGGPGTSNTGIALGAAKMGLKSECFFKSLELDDEIFLTYDVYKKHPEKIQKAREFFLQLWEECRLRGISINEKYLSTDEILERLNENSIPIVCVDAAKFYGAKKAMPHIVVVVGYNSDKSSIFINDPAQGPFVRISTAAFNRARESSAIDGEVVIISRK